ncbi:MAG: hypothetical protein ACLU9X_00490 [Alistipes shahii]
MNSKKYSPHRRQDRAAMCSPARTARSTPTRIAALGRPGSQPCTGPASEFILVSSGAVAAGGACSKPASDASTPFGPPALLGRRAGETLIRRTTTSSTHAESPAGRCSPPSEDFETAPPLPRTSATSIRVMLENGVVPIVNENDTVAVTELMFTDNDELSGLARGDDRRRGARPADQRRRHLRRYAGDARRRR